MERGLESETEWTGKKKEEKKKKELSKVEFLAAGEACKAKF